MPGFYQREVVIGALGGVAQAEEARGAREAHRLRRGEGGQEVVRRARRRRGRALDPAVPAGEQVERGVVFGVEPAGRHGPALAVWEAHVHLAQDVRAGQHLHEQAGAVLREAGAG